MKGHNRFVRQIKSQHNWFVLQTYFKLIAGQGQNRFILKTTEAAAFKHWLLSTYQIKEEQKNIFSIFFLGTDTTDLSWEQQKSVQV